MKVGHFIIYIYKNRIKIDLFYKNQTIVSSRRFLTSRLVFFNDIFFSLKDCIQLNVHRDISLTKYSNTWTDAVEITNGRKLG